MGLNKYYLYADMWLINHIYTNMSMKETLTEAQEVFGGVKLKIFKWRRL